MKPKDVRSFIPFSYHREQLYSIIGILIRMIIVCNLFRAAYYTLISAILYMICNTRHLRPSTAWQAAPHGNLR